MEGFNRYVIWRFHVAPNENWVTYFFAIRSNRKDCMSSQIVFRVTDCKRFLLTSWWKLMVALINTAWKVSVFGVIPVCIFPHSDWIRTRITPNTDTFDALFPFNTNSRCPLKDHIYLEKPTAFNCRFAQVCMTINWTLGNKLFQFLLLELAGSVYRLKQLSLFSDSSSDKDLSFYTSFEARSCLGVYITLSMRH